MMHSYCAAARIAGAWVLIGVLSPIGLPAADTLLARPEYSLEVWDTDRGIPGSADTSIVSTPDGYLWIGTYEGLARFDGVRFVVTNHANTPEFPADAVTALLVDRNGELWAGTGNGIAHREKGIWHAYPGPDGTPLRFASYMVDDPSGTVLAVAGDNRLYGLSGDHFAELPSPPGAKYLKIYSVPGDGVWGSAEHFVGRYRTGHWEGLTVPADLSTLFGTAPGRTRGIWVAGSNTIRKYQDGTWSAPIAMPAGIEFTPPVTILEDSDGNIWTGDYRNGLILIRKDGSTLKFGRSEGLPNPTIRALFEGPGHILWAATDGGGLVRFRKLTVSMLDESSGLTYSVVDTVLEESPGNLLVGTYGGGVLRFDENTMGFGLPLAPPGSQLTPGTHVLSLARDPRGTIWAGTYARGLFRIEGGRAEPVPETVDSRWVVSVLLMDQRKTLWIGYQHGLASYTGGKMTIYNSQQGAPSSDIVALALDASGDLWAGGSDGLFHLHDGRFERFTPPGMRVYGPINALYADSAGALWIAMANRGLDRWQNGKFTSYGPAQGLVASHVTSIVEDNQGRLWLGTQRQGLVGITRASLDAVTEGKQSQIAAVWLTRNEGLATNQMRAGFQPAAWKGSDGRLWFATMKGLALVDPRQAWQIQEPAPARIEEVVVANRRIPFEQIEGDTLVVPAGNRRLQFVFTQPNFSDPERSRFQYRLEGLDSTWQDAAERSAAFADVRPGTYTFRVRAGNSSGTWSSQSAAIKLNVQPYFWETLWFRIVLVLALIIFTAGAVYGMQGLKLRHKTEQLEREQALRRDIERMQKVLKMSEERFAKAFHSSPFPMSINTLEDGRFLDVNQRFLERTGLSREEVIGRRRAELDLWVDPEEAARFSDATQANKRLRNFEAQLKGINGQSAYYLLSTEVIELDGQPCLLVASDDVTERKHLEEQLNQAQKLESIGRLAGGVAHDFNNLLTVINGYSELVLTRLEPTDKNWARVDQIRNAGMRAAELTGQLLAFSRKQVIKPQALDLNTLIAETEPMLRRLLPENIEISVHLDSTGVLVLADPGQLNQVLINLAANARDAMPDGGELTVETRRAEVDQQFAALHSGLAPGSYAMLAMSDNGAGMTEEVKRHVFEPFFTTKKKGAGTGLGLATVYGIVRQNGGWIWVYSELGKGATFKIYLPLADVKPVQPEPKPHPAGSWRGSETVLVVEDQPNVRELAREVLESYGYAVLDAGNGATALQMASTYSGPIHLMLTDVVMPGMTGKELAERMKPVRPSTKVLFMSGYTENVIANQGVIDSSINFISKPLAPDALAAKVREILGPVETQ